MKSTVTSLDKWFLIRRNPPSRGTARQSGSVGHHKSKLNPSSALFYSPRISFGFVVSHLKTFSFFSFFFFCVLFCIFSGCVFVEYLNWIHCTLFYSSFSMDPLSMVASTNENRQSEEPDRGLATCFF